MRPRLILQPIHESSADILKTFAEGKPLTNEQQHFLEWHQKELNAWYDPVLKYYLDSRRKKREYQGTFLLPHEEMNFEAIQALKKRIHATLRNKFSHAIIKINQKQFLTFKQLAVHELIFWRGNQFLTGSPFYPSGIPPVIFFQWGNLFGVVKYLVLSAEKTLKANILVYFEDLQDRELEQCVNQFNEHLKNDIQLQHEFVLENEWVSKTPREEESHEMRPSRYFLIDHF